LSDSADVAVWLRSSCFVRGRDVYFFGKVETAKALFLIESVERMLAAK